MLMNELLEKESHSVEYPCSIGAVNISKERNLYTVLRRKYSNLAREAVSQFSAFYDSYTNCNDILRKSSSDFQKSISSVIDEIKKEIISMECYEWDYDTIYQYANEHGYLNPFYEASDSVCEKIIAVNENLEEQKRYRQERKDNRARWEGGSIGGTMIDNYAHQASLGMMNVAEGMGHVMGMLGCAEQKANKLLNELDCTKGAGLIERVRRGLGKPNVIYVKNFICRAEPGQQRPQTGNCENHKPGDVKTTIQEMRKPQTDHTGLNHTGFHAAGQSICPAEAEASPVDNVNPAGYGMDRTGQMGAYRERIKENIDYDYLLHDRPYDRERLDGFVELMAETCCSSRKSIRINQGDMSTEVVKSRFLKLGNEVRRRIDALLEPLAEDKDCYLQFMDRYLKAYQENNVHIGEPDGI